MPDTSARELLTSAAAAPLDERVLTRILAETHGNPLALLELPRRLSPALLAGGFGLPDCGSLPARIEASFERRVQRLPAATQRLLLLAAGDPTGEPELLVRAAAELGTATDELAPAEADGLLQIGLQVVFRQPLLRSAIYRQHRPTNVEPHIRRWRQPPIPSSTPIAEPGIARMRSQGLMRTSRSRSRSPRSRISVATRIYSASRCVPSTPRGLSRAR